MKINDILKLKSNQRFKKPKMETCASNSDFFLFAQIGLVSS